MLFCIVVFQPYNTLIPKHVLQVMLFVNNFLIKCAICIKNQIFVGDTVNVSFLWLVLFRPLSLSAFFGYSFVQTCHCQLSLVIVLFRSLSLSAFFGYSFVQTCVIVSFLGLQFCSDQGEETTLGYQIEPETSRIQ